MERQAQLDSLGGPVFPSGLDPYDPDGTQGGGEVPPQRGFSGLDAHLEAMRPDAPPPKKVLVVRLLMFIGGFCGLGLALMILMSFGVPDEAMREAMDEQAALMAEEGVALELGVDQMRFFMLAAFLVTGLYGLLSTLLAARLRRRTVGAFWGVVIFQGIAGAILAWGLFSGDLMSVIPLGFTVVMIVCMLSKEGRAYHGLL